jgi:hypothetical protein
MAVAVKAGVSVANGAWVNNEGVADGVSGASVARSLIAGCEQAERAIAERENNSNGRMCFIELKIQIQIILIISVISR